MSSGAGFLRVPSPPPGVMEALTDEDPAYPEVACLISYTQPRTQEDVAAANAEHLTVLRALPPPLQPSLAGAYALWERVAADLPVLLEVLVAKGVIRTAGFTLDV